ncbi:MAG: hypothetical protein KGJ66_05920 [Alphaproteobacteria bacterium]|nr:hypothetical protein [Alphaproteobacteria bacterium]
MKICCYAFAGTALFFRALVKLCRTSGDDVEWSVIFPQAPFRDSFDDVIPATRRLYLYEDFDRVYRQTLPPYDWRNSVGVENIYRTMARDKGGYRHLDKDEQFHRAATIAKIYREFLELTRPDYVLLPDVEAVNGYILMNLCNELSIPMLYYVDLRLLGRGFFSTQLDNALPPYFGEYTDDDLAAARDVLAAFRAGKPRAAGNRYPPMRLPKPPLLRRVVRNTWLRWRYERRHATDETIWMRARVNMQRFVYAYRHWWFDAVSTAYFDLIKPDAPLPKHYIFYPLHISPESSINGTEPFFIDQLRAIDLLLYNMPGSHSLVVKEHPASIGIRPHGFYRALRARPGVILAHPDFPTARLIEHAALVTTITGTVGLECYFLDKPCLLMGPVFFSHLCYRLDSIKAFGHQLREIIANYRPPTEQEKTIEIAKLLNVSGDFVINDPWFVPAVCAPANIAAAREHILQTIKRRGRSTGLSKQDVSLYQADSTARLSAHS